MGVIFKVLNSLLGIVAIVVCLAAVGIIVYSATQPNMGGSTPPTVAVATADEEQTGTSPTPGGDTGESPGPEGTAEATLSPDHVHEYTEIIELEADCLASGLKKFTCECGDYYYEDIPAVGHVPGEWEIVTAATATQTGLRVRKCIYCDIILASEVISPIDAGTSGGNTEVHIHDYVASMESEATCTTAGIRRFVCSCGSYYRETVHAIGHIVGEWTVAVEATTTGTGMRQRICEVCHNLIDSQVIPVLPPTPSPSVTPGASPAGNATPSPTPTPTASPSPTPHVHNYEFYVYKEATCSELGISTGRCVCGAEVQQKIEKNPDRHNYSITVVKPTATQGGYTRHRCTWCGYTYTDNETPATG